MAERTVRRRLRAFAAPLFMGVLIGAGGVAPGISGGALAVVFGVYDRLASLAAHPREAVRQWRFCLPIGAGILLGTVTLGRGLSAFFRVAPVAARCLFIGLLAGTFPQVLRTAARDGVRPRYALYAALGAVAGWGLLCGGFLPKMTAPTFGTLVFCGIILGIGTAVPGVSSSFILLSMGAYDWVLSALGGERADFWLPLGLGFAAGIALTVRLVDVLYRRAYGAFSFAVCGFLAASFVPVWPPLSWDTQGIMAGVLGLLSAAASFWLSRTLSRNDSKGAHISARTPA